MKHEELKRHYDALKMALDHGHISKESFQESVNHLRYEDEQGVWHQLDAKSASWLFWEVDHWQVESGPAKAAKGELQQHNSIPEGFWALIAVILKNTLKMFFTRLPIMLLFIVAAWVFHTYLLVAVNNGFGKGAIENFVSRQVPPTVSILIIWSVGSMLFMGFLSRLFGKSKGPGLRERLIAMKNYFNESRKDAVAVALGGFGASLIVGTLVNTQANLVVAVGVGALIASRSGAVIALLFNSAWTSMFGAVWRNNLTRYGSAVGDLTIFASSFGFIANSVLTPDGATIGVVLLIVSLVIALGTKISLAITPLLIPGLIILGSSFFGFDLLWADDGGLIDGGTDGTWLGWWNNTGRNPAIAMGVGPAIAAALGLSIQQGLKDTSANLLSNIQTPASQSSEDKYGNDNILDGTNALNWMLGHDYFIKEDGQLVATDKFKDFMKSLPSESGTELQGFAVGSNNGIPLLDAEGNLIDGYAIIRDGTPAPQKKKPPVTPVTPVTPVVPPVTPVTPVTPVVPPVTPVTPVTPVVPPVTPVTPVTPVKQGPSLAELTDKWRSEEKDLKSRIDSAEKRINYLKIELPRLECEYDINRYTACSDATIDLVDLWVGVVLKKLSPKTSGQAFGKGIFKGSIKTVIRQIIQGGPQLPTPMDTANYINNGVGLKLPPSSLARYKIKKFLEAKGWKKTAKGLGPISKMSSTALAVSKNMDSVADLRHKIISLSSEYRELNRNLEDWKLDLESIQRTLAKC